MSDLMELIKKSRTGGSTAYHELKLELEPVVSAAIKACRDQHKPMPPMSKMRMYVAEEIKYVTQSFYDKYSKSGEQKELDSLFKEFVLTRLTEALNRRIKIEPDMRFFLDEQLSAYPQNAIIEAFHCMFSTNFSHATKEASNVYEFREEFWLLCTLMQKFVDFFIQADELQLPSIFISDANALERLKAQIADVIERLSQTDLRTDFSSGLKLWEQRIFEREFPQMRAWEKRWKHTVMKPGMTIVDKPLPDRPEDGWGEPNEMLQFREATFEFWDRIYRLDVVIHIIPLGLQRRSMDSQVLDTLTPITKKACEDWIDMEKQNEFFAFAKTWLESLDAAIDITQRFQSQRNTPDPI